MFGEASQAVDKLLRLLKTGRGPGTQWLRVTAIEEFLIFEAGQGVVWVPALVLEPGAFSTRRTPFNQVLSSFTGSKTLTLQADAGRFRINSFSGQILDYDPSPVRPKGFEPCADEENSEPPGAKPANVVPIVLDNKRVQATAPQTPTLPMQPAPSEIEIIQPKDKTERVSSAGNPMTREVDPSGAPQKQATSEPEVEKNDQGGDRYFGGYGQYAQTFTNPTSAEIYHTYCQNLTGDTRPRPSSNAPAPKPAEPSLARAYKWTGANMVGSVRRNVAATLVIAYAVFVLGSLFCAPWEGSPITGQISSLRGRGEIRRLSIE